MNSEQLVLETLKKEQKALKTSEIAVRAKLDQKEVNHVIKRLKAEGKITSPKRCYYALK